MDNTGRKGYELWISQSQLLSKICGIDISQSSLNNPDSKNPFNSLFFTIQNSNALTLSLPIRILLKNCPNFNTINNDTINNVEVDEIENFRERFLSLLNQGRGAGISDKIPFLSVAFLHFCGKTRTGYMTRSELKGISLAYEGIFGIGDLEDKIFKCLDNENSGMVSILNFICGFIACSPEVDDSPKSFEGKLRLQHIFTVYDLDRDGQLDKSELSLLISDIYNQGKFNNSQESIINDVETLLSRFDTFTYDVFYKCVEIGAIQHTEILFRIAFDLAEKLKEHLVFALANIKISSSTLVTREPLWSNGVEKMYANNNNNNSTSFGQFGQIGNMQYGNSTNFGQIGQFGNIQYGNIQYGNSQYNQFGNMQSVDSTYKYPIINEGNGVYSFHPSIFSDRSGLSSERSEGVDIYSQINSIYSPPQSDCRNFPYQITKIQSFKPIEHYKPIITVKNEPTTNIKKIESEPINNDENAINELEIRIESLIKDYFKRFIVHANEDIVDQKVAISVFTLMYKTFFGLETEKIESLINPFRWCNYHNLLVLCNNFSHLMAKQRQIVSVNSPVHIIGDLGTNFISLIRIFNMYGWPLHSRLSQDKSTLTHVVINVSGRTKDQNSYPLEYLIFVMSLKVLFPKHVTVIGYYERCDNMIETYNCHFYNEIFEKLQKYKSNFNLLNDNALISQSAKELLNKIIDIFDVMPKGVLIDRAILFKGVNNGYENVFNRYRNARLTITPHSDQGNIGLFDYLNNSNDPEYIQPGSKYALDSGSVFISGNKIIYNPLD